ncbi:MAG: site-2 protease family protein [Elusimicrobia bacterium]|nr:site-2 protease family protein [Elusimicrobiota bacterium]
MIALSIILALGLVVFFHEFGHFICCRMVGIRVLRFAFGFGPEIVGFTRGETRYSICAFPLGGFVKPAGEDPEEITGAKDEFFSKSWKARILVALAGPWMNYVFSFVLFWFGFWWFGTPELSKEPAVGVVMTGSPAEAAGLKAGDRVESVLAKAKKEQIVVATWDELSKYIHAHAEKDLTLNIKRAGESLAVNVVPRKDPGRGIGLIGIMPEVIRKKEGLFTAAVLSVKELYHWSFSSLSYLWDKFKKWEKPDLAGPVGIVTMMNQAARSGVDNFLALLAAISVAIGLFNLFPIPLLDGGHVLLYLWEAIAGKKITRRVLVRANTVGMAILIPIFLFAFYNDLARMWANRAAKAKGEFGQVIESSQPPAEQQPAK